MIQAIFFDMDGTLLSHHSGIVPASTVKAFHLLRARGIKLFLATGRHITELADLPVQDLFFDGYVTLNGQYCFDDEAVIYKNAIAKSDVRNMVRKALDESHPLGIVEAERIYMNMVNDDVMVTLKDIHTPLPEICDITRALDHDIYQAMTYGDESWIRDCIPHCVLKQWHPLGYDVVPENGGKKQGILKILDQYQIPLSAVMVFGDGQNDEDMFELVPHSVAMGNAQPDLKKMARFVTKDIDEDGVYFALKHFGVI